MGLLWYQPLRLGCAHDIVIYSVYSGIGGITQGKGVYILTPFNVQVALMGQIY